MRELDLTHYYDFDKLLSHQKDFKKIFFYRICGTGMGACAALFLEKGFEVFGYDKEFYPPMGDYLKSLDITLFEQSPTIKELKEYDLIVVGNVIARNSDEAMDIEKSETPFCSFPTALGAMILKDYSVLGIAGTHGKTTTTYFAAQLFENLGLDPSYFIGGVIEGKKSSKASKGKYFFIEADEYDSSYFEKVSKFRLYRPNHLILTSLEFDHADIFNSIEDIKDQFRATLNNFDGQFIYCEDYKAAVELNSEFKLKSYPYGKKNIEIVSMDQKGSEFKLNGELYKTNILGVHNIYNLSSLILFCLNEAIDSSKVKEAILDLKMVKRRQEYRGLYKKSIVIDDFAHHPRAVTETLNAIRAQYPNKEIVTIIEPNSATARSSLFEKEFEEALFDSDIVVMAKPARPTTIKNQKDLDCERIVDSLGQSEKQAYLARELDELLSIMDNLAHENRLFLILSNGTCLGLWKSTFTDQLTL